MLRPTTAALSRALALSAALLGASSLQAQESTTRGFNVGLHLSGASLDLENGDRHHAGGAGLIVGYGINRTIEVFLQLDAAEFDVDDTEVQGKWAMGHGDLGVRFHFANSLRTWVPYLQAAIGGRAVGVEDAVVNGQPATDVEFFGGTFSLGGGIMFYFNQTLAADLQLLWSGGEFTEIKVDDVTVGGLEIEAQSTRFNVGVSWWP
jgi:hypothetical protein